MKKLLLLSLLIPFTASAGTAEDIAKVRALLPPGFDIADYQFKTKHGPLTQEQAIEEVKLNFLISDFNRDGLEDVLVVTCGEEVKENPPGAVPSNPGTKSEGDCGTYAEGTELQFYLGGKGWIFKSNDILPYGGSIHEDFRLELRANGSVRLSTYIEDTGVPADAYTLQFRDGDFYVIGKNYEYVNWEDGEDDGAYYGKGSTNYLTGRSVRIFQKTKHSRKVRKVENLPRKPLVKVADYKM